MTEKTLAYWRERFIDGSTSEIISEMEKLVQDKDSDGLAYSFLAVVEAMGNSDLSTVESFLANIMENLYVLKLASPDSQDFKDNEKHWKEEMHTWRRDIYIRLRREPSIRRKIPDMIRDNMLGSKKAAIRHLSLDLYFTLKTLPDLTVEEILPPEQDI